MRELSEDRPHLTAVAELLADGGTPDWDAASSHASDDERGLINQLRLAADVVRQHPLTWRSRLSSDTRITTPVLEPNTELGALRIVEHVGRGHFGHVYRAWDSTLQREVALKVLHDRTADTEEVLNEGRLMARVRHPSVVTIHSMHNIDGRAALCMEFIKGATLEEDLRERGPRPPAEVAAVGIALCDALDAVHAAGLIHRDVKAQNVMRDKGGRIVLGDFGTGRAWASDHRPGEIAGTPAYAAPEVLKSQHATVQSDIYSLGVLLFHLATGSYPVEGFSLREIGEAHEADRRRTLRTIRPRFPADLAAVVQRAIDPDPARRFESALEMRRALFGWRAGKYRWLLAAAILFTLLAVVTAFWQSTGPFSPRFRAGLGGFGLQRLDPALQAKVVLRGPAVENVMGCTPPGQMGVAICDLRSGSHRVLRPEVATPDKRGELAPAFAQLVSPDGTRLAYTWVTIDPPGKWNYAIHVIDVDGRDDRRLFVSEGAVAVKKWIHDGATLSLDEEINGIHRDLLVPADGGPVTEVWRLGPEDSITDVSPDGRLLAVSRVVTPADRDLVVIDLATRRERWRFPHAGDDAWPVWTPDGRNLVFVNTRGGQSFLMLEGVRDGLPQRPVFLHDVARSRILTPPMFAPDGSLFMRVRTAPRTAYSASVDWGQHRVSAPRPLELTTPEDSQGADWSPSGDRVAYVRGRVGASPISVVIRRLDGRLERELPIDGVFAEFSSQVRWSPFGDRLAVLYGEGQFNVLDIIDLATEKRDRLLRAPRLYDPRWDRSATALFMFHADRFIQLPGAIRRLDLKTGQLEPVFAPSPGTRLIETFDRSPTGNLLVRIAAVGEDACTFRVVRIDGHHKDFSFPGVTCPAAAWVNDGRTFLVSRTETGADGQLWLVDIDTERRTSLTLQADLISKISITSDGQQLLFTAGNPRPDMWMLTGLSSR